MSTETESKTYVFGNDGSNMVSMLAPLLQQKGVDPNLLAALNNGGGFGGNNGSWFIWLLFILVIWGRNGLGGQEGLSNQINNDYGRDLLMQAVNGNRGAISELATNLNCDVNAIQSTLATISSSIQSVGSQVGMSSQSVINSIQAGNCQIANQIAQCCCENKQLVMQSNYDNQIATLNQTNQLGSKIDQQTTFLSDKFCQLEKRELSNKIDSLREKNTQLENQISNANQTLAIQNYVAATVAPLSSAVAALQGDINGIKCKLPETVNVPNPQGVFVPGCTAAALGLYGNGIFNNGSIWS